MTNHNSPVSTLRQRMLEDMQLRKLNTTALYSQVATRTLRDVRSPLEKLKLKKKPPN